MKDILKTKNKNKTKKSFRFNPAIFSLSKMFKSFSKTKTKDYRCASDRLFGEHLLKLFKIFKFHCKTLLNSGASREVTLFSKTNFSFSFKPYFAAQGALVFAILLFLLVAVGTFIFPPVKIDTAKLISPQSIIVKQVSAAIANQPVKWTAIVKRSQIKENQNFVQLPKSARNIKVKTISKENTEALLAKTIPQASSQLTLNERKQLAAESQPPSFFAAGLLSKFSKFFLANIEDGIDQLAEAVTQEVIITDEAKLVDLSENAPIAPMSDIGETEQDKKKEEKKEKKEKKEEEKKEAEKEETPSEEQPAEQPAEELEDPSFQELPVKNVEPLETVSLLEVVEILNTVAPSAPMSDIGEAPITQTDEFVQITYETPGPTITEQDTNTGKLVTVSSANTEVIDCETLNPAKKDSAADQSAALSPAGLLDGVINAFKNIIASLSKFLFADLEQAVEEIISNFQFPISSEQPADEAKDKDKQDEEAKKEEVKEEKQEEKQETTEEKKNDEDETEVSVSPDLTPTPTEETESLGGLTPQQETPGLTESNDQNLTPAPLDAEDRSDLSETSAEQAADTAYQNCLKQQVSLTDVLAFTTIPEIYKVGQENRIKIKWKNGPASAEASAGEQEMPFTAFDLNNNGKLDYIEWIVPRLSDQYFEIIFISKAWELDSNQNIISDIYDQVRTKEGSWQDGTFATVPQDNYVRVTFEQVLDNTKDITIYARPSQEGSDTGLTPTVIGNPTIEVYPVYTDEQGNQTQGGLIAVFPVVDKEDTYKVLLTSLETPTDTFDLKVVRGE